MRRDRAIGPLVKRSHQVPWPVISEAWQRHVITKPFSAESIHIFSQLMFARDFLGIHRVAQPKMIKMAMALQQLHHDILESGYLKYPTCKFQICPKLPKFVQLQKPRETDQTSDPVTSGEKSATSPKKIRQFRPRWRDIHWVDCRIPHAQARPSLVPVMALAPGGKQHLMEGFRSRHHWDSPTKKGICDMSVTQEGTWFEPFFGCWEKNMDPISKLIFPIVFRWIYEPFQDRALRRCFTSSAHKSQTSGAGGGGGLTSCFRECFIL